ncbi:MAG: HIT domain-containing protein [Candidatus Omnitrophota bacterium]
MDKLWAPWRIKYISAKKTKQCIFCAALKSKHKNYVVFKNKYTFCLLNTFPYNNGHLMIAPIRHLKGLSQLNNNEALELFQSINTAKSMLDKVLKPDGYNIGINLSKSAGAGITGHIHIHIVPRWQGDTNFMPVLNNTKIISQSLNELCKQLEVAYAKSGGNKKI